MKKIYLALATLGFFCAKAQLNVSIINNTGSNSITCSSPVINLVGTSTYTANPVTYVWNTPTGVVTGTTLNVTTGGVYTLAAVSGSLVGSQTISIGVNTIVPVSAVSPSTQTVTCNYTSITTVTMTAISPTFNITHKLTPPTGAIYFSNTFTSSYAPQAGSGTYTYTLIDNQNGCSSTKTFTVNSSQGYPTYSVTSPQNFTLGCNSKSVAIINIINANTTPPGGAISYSILAPGNSSITPIGPLASISVYTVNYPGTWTVVVKDNNSFCESRSPVSIIQNTISPAISNITIPNQILTCSQPSTQIQASTGNPNAQFMWSWPTGSVNTSNLNASANFTVPATNTLLANYTLEVTDPDNACKTITVVPVYQNVFPPKANITAATPGTSTMCGTPGVILTNISTSGIPVNSIFPNTQPVVATLWSGPSPMAPLALSTICSANVQGMYTLTATDLNNGCVSYTTISVSNPSIQPFLSTPTGTQYTISCPGGTVNLTAVVAGTGANLIYNWQYPQGAAVSGTSTPTLNTNAQGNYTLTVTSNPPGCSQSVSYNVWACTGILNQTMQNSLIQIYPNPSNGVINILLNKSTANTSLKIINSIGQTINQLKVTDAETMLNLSEQPAGLYFIYLLENEKTVAISKLIKG